MGNKVWKLEIRTPRPLTDEEANAMETMLAGYLDKRFKEYSLEEDHEYKECPLCKQRTK